MSRLFDGVDDLMTYTDTDGWLTTGGAKTLLAVIKIATTTDNSWLSIIECEAAASDFENLAMGRTDGGLIYSVRGGGGSGITISDADGWMVMGWSVAAGTSTVRFHKVLIGGAATHTNAGGTQGDATNNIEEVKIGGDDDWFNGYYAAAAIFNSELTDGNFETIATAATSLSIASFSPVWMVDDSDAFATNLVDPGLGDRTAIVGTTDSGDDPSGWVYGLVEDTSASQRFMWMP